MFIVTEYAVLKPVNKDVNIKAFAWLDYFDESRGDLSNILEIQDMRKELVLIQWMALKGKTDQYTNFMVLYTMIKM